MAQQRLRPGPWKLVAGGSDQTCQIDYETFDIPASTTVEFEVQHMGLYDDTDLTAYRNPVTTFVQTGNVGQGMAIPIKEAPKKKISK
tara:strand:- start:2099 stop:2359 length:261 start_codon:yes stop_codon:yes gene_type:complete